MLIRLQFSVNSFYNIFQFKYSKKFLRIFFKDSILYGIILILTVSPEYKYMRFKAVIKDFRFRYTLNNQKIVIDFILILINFLKNK